MGLARQRLKAKGKGATVCAGPDWAGGAGERAGVLGYVLVLAGRFLLRDLGKAGLGAGFGSKSRLG